MNIGFIGHGLSLLSGSSKPIFQLMNALQKNGVKTEMLSDQLNDSVSLIHAELENKLGLGNLKVERLKGNIIYGLIKGKSDVLEPIRAFMNEYDLIICTDFMFAWLLDKKKFKRDIPLVFLASNNMDFKIKFLVDSGLISSVNLLKPRFLIKLLLPTFFNRILLSRFDYILTTSMLVKRTTNCYNLSIPVSFLPVGVDASSIFSDGAIGVYDDVFSYFGWGSGIRGIQDVLKAFEIYRDLGGNATLKLYLQGQHGYEEKFYVKRIRKSKFSNFIDIKFFNTNIEEAILSSKAVLLPFRVPFGYSQPPLTILESMALGQVVISTKVGCITELINNGHDGFLVNPARPDEIAKIMRELNEDIINRVGCNAHNKIRDAYSWDVLVKEYVKKFEEIITVSPRRLFVREWKV